MMTIKKINRLAEKYIMYLLLLRIKRRRRADGLRKLNAEWIREVFPKAEMGGGPASYIPAHTSSALAASFRT